MPYSPIDQNISKLYSVVAPGQTSDQVKQLQGALISAGFAIPAGATGFYGDQTKSAVSQWLSKLQTPTTPAQPPITPTPQTPATPNTPAPTPTPITPTPTTTTPATTTPTTPTPTPATPTTPKPDFQVEAGSNLTRAAQAMGISLQQLLDANPQYKANPNMVQAGALLKYPTGAVNTVVSNTTPNEQTPNAGANTTLQSDLQKQLDDAQAQLKAMQDYGLTDTSDLELDANGNYVPKVQAEADKAVSALGLGSATGTMSIGDIITKVSDAFGLPQVKADIKALDDDYADEVMEVNDNPWYSEGQRSKELSLIQGKYDTKKNALYERLKSESTIVAKALDIYEQEENRKQAILLKNMEIIADKQKEDDKDTADLLEYEYAKSQGYAGTFMDWQKQSANLKATSSGATGLNIAQMNSTINSIVGSFDNEPIVKNYNEVSNKFQSVKEILNSGVGGPGDLAIVYEFMKGLDPSSVVRETEYATAAKSGNIFQGVFAQFNGYLKLEGGFLPENVKKSFLSILQTKLNVAKTQYDNLYKEYQNRIKTVEAGGYNTLPDYGKAFQGESIDSNLSDDEAYELYLEKTGQSPTTPAPATTPKTIIVNGKSYPAGTDIFNNTKLPWQ